MSERILDFPQDGERWWIRWVDGFSLPDDLEAGRQVDVLLSKIPNRYRHLSPEQLPMHLLKGELPSDEWIQTVSVGMLPRLVIGGVFQYGYLTGYISGTTKTFSFKRASTYYDVANISPAIVAEPDDAPNRQETLIPKSAYPLHGEFAASSCVLLERNGVRLLIPCTEILRQWFCPQRSIAHAILGGPWDRTSDHIIKKDETGVNADGEYEVVLRGGINPELRDVLASLYFSKQGRRAARNLYAQLVQRPVATKLRVGFPFEWNELAIEVQCMLVRRKPRTYLALRINRMSSPWAGHTIAIASQHASSPDKGAPETSGSTREGDDVLSGRVAKVVETWGMA